MTTPAQFQLALACAFFDLLQLQRAPLCGNPSAALAETAYRFGMSRNALALALVRRRAAKEAA